MPFALIIPVSFETVSATGRGLSLMTISISFPVVSSVIVNLLLRRVIADEVRDHGSEKFTRVLLQEMAGAFDHWMLEARRPGHSFLQHRRHASGDRVAVAERHQERLIPSGQLTPGGPVGLRGRVI